MLYEFVPADRPGSATFTISASDCPQLLCRLLGYVASQGRCVDVIQGVHEGDKLLVSIVLKSINNHRAELLAERFRMIINVEHVQIAFEAGL